VRRVGKYALRLLAGLGLLFLALVALALAFRLPLARWALGNALADAGLTPRDIRVTQLGLRGTTVAPLDISWRGQRIDIDSVTVRRLRLFSRSLGRIELKGVSVELDLAALTAPRPAGTVAAAAGARPAISGNGVTFDQFSVDGRITLQAPGAGRELALSLTATPAEGGSDLRFTATLAGAGVEAQANGHYDLVQSVAEFDLTHAKLELADGWALLRELAPALATGWEAGGTLTVTGRGRAANGAVTGEMALHLRDGSAGNAGEKLSIDGVQADVVLSDPMRVATAPGQIIRAVSARLGNVTLRDAAVRFQLNGVHECRVESAEVAALGGRLSFEPFICDPTAGAIACVVAADGLRVEEVLALFPDAPAKATGQIDGRLPLVFDKTGLHFGVGWVGLRKGQAADVRFNAPGLLTRSLDPKNPAFVTLQGIEAGRTPLSVEELRVDLHPEGAPSGRSAQIHIVGHPVDQGGPLGRMTLDLNVNGPLESLLNWGLQTKFGAPAAGPAPAGTKVEAD